MLKSIKIGTKEQSLDLMKEERFNFLMKAIEIKDGIMNEDSKDINNEIINSMDIIN
jgi:hypothetical protein